MIIPFNLTSKVRRIISSSGGELNLNGWTIPNLKKWRDNIVEFSCSDYHFNFLIITEYKNAHVDKEKGKKQFDPINFNPFNTKRGKGIFVVISELARG